MEESPVKEINEIESRNISDIEFKKMVISMHKELNWQLQGTEWELQQHEKGNRNYKQEPGRNEEYNF